MIRFETIRVVLSVAASEHLKLAQFDVKSVFLNQFLSSVFQKDIWPHGSTYPRKAVAIDRRKILTPTIQVCMGVGGIVILVQYECIYK